MKTAIWLYLFLFVAFFDLHAQYPILTPFAISLGAAPSFIGLMMGMYSITHLPGNIMAGYGVDRFGSRLFIVFSLMGAGVVLLFQSKVTDPWQLLVLRSISGFVLAFLSPACLALLARISSDVTKQGKFMAGNGLVHTLATVVSPAAGAYLVARIGFTTAFYLLGWVLIITAVCALFFIRDIKAAPAAQVEPAPSSAKPVLNEGTPIPWLVFLLPVAMSCAQGILSFELPLMATSSEGMMETGILFSVVSIGALITLSMLFLNKLSSYYRTLWGALGLALVYFTIAAQPPLPFFMLLLFVGMAKGIVLPAISTLLIELSGGAKYGRTFSVLSIAYSVGAFLGPMLAGHLRDNLSPYYLAFLGLMIGVCVLPFHRRKTTLTPIFPKSR
ncbi:MULTISPECIES: MFS transporter [unclassified Paenibacillus]|uniref:MFS transporter n=1 Tax=unclassified Paenibacillus TaxID=185978 RepID=UPI001048ACA1|nr:MULTISPECIES: MFS transporter [unclassified Paenibacillus]NIK70216.1 MFS family permease [Paenibacillus sp. BK720]TCM98043.1 putative MFS family arabinose efflux permease [Paenibacillus sp. BK033]